MPSWGVKMMMTASSRAISSRDVTPDTSLSQRMGGRVSKKLKKRARPEETTITGDRQEFDSDCTKVAASIMTGGGVP
jgi:hypothetical protein